MSKDTDAEEDPKVVADNGTEMSRRRSAFSGAKAKVSWSRSALRRGWVAARNFAWRYHTLFWVALLIGVLLAVLLVNYLFAVAAGDKEVFARGASAEYTAIPGAPRPKVAVVGAGAAGLTAAWTLAASRAYDVTVYEGNTYPGGHCYTYGYSEHDPEKLLSPFAVEQNATTGNLHNFVKPEDVWQNRTGVAEAGGYENWYDWQAWLASGKVFDLGYIFNNKGYNKYRAATRHYNITRHFSALNTSSWYENHYWDNNGWSYENKGSEMDREVDEFLAEGQKPATMTRALLPLDWWLFFKRYSDAFIQRALLPTLEVLFVTKRGLMFTSAQATLKHYREGSFTFLKYDNSYGTQLPGGVNPNARKVQFTQGGCSAVWHRITRDFLSFGKNRTAMHLNTRVQSAYRRESDQKWVVRYHHKHPGTVHSEEVFDHVVLAVHAGQARAILKQGREERDQSSFHQIFTEYMLEEISYNSEWASLHQNPAVVKPTSADRIAGGLTRHPHEPLYHIYKDSFSGWIDTISGNTCPGRQYLLTLTKSAGTAGRLGITDPLIEFEWEHHEFTMWNLVSMKGFFPWLVNGKRGLFFAGDWLRGIGHNDAMESGIDAATAIGIPPPAAAAVEDRPLYQSLIGLGGSLEETEADWPLGPNPNNPVEHPCSPPP